MNVSTRRPNRRAPRLDRVYEGSSRTLQAARTDLVDWLQQNGVDEDVQDRAALVVSELATNAIQAAPGFEYIVSGSIDRGDVALTVVSHTDFEQPPPREHWGPPAALAGRGRGLMIVDDLSTDVVVEVPSQGTVMVTATLRAPSL
jgi:anti-sigma regulatory factor (Ser/Thr protein kinase)